VQEDGGEVVDYMEVRIEEPKEEEVEKREEARRKLDVGVEA